MSYLYKIRLQFFSPKDRSNIIHNAFVDSYVEPSKYASLVSMLSYLSNEKDYLPWQTLVKHSFNMFKVLDYKRSFYQVSVSFF